MGPKGGQSEAIRGEFAVKVFDNCLKARHLALLVASGPLSSVQYRLTQMPLNHQQGPKP